LRAERDEAVVLVTGRLGDRVEWSIGEALVNVNYRVSGKQAAYVYAMAEKRAKDRVILKLIELHGLVYSEEEADEFKEGRPDHSPEQRSNVTPMRDPVESLLAAITSAETDAALSIVTSKPANIQIYEQVSDADQVRMADVVQRNRDEFAAAGRRAS
jgi:hypothetical protein